MKRKRPVAPNKSRPMGMDRGKIRMAEDFDRADPELERLFCGPVATEFPELASALAKMKKQLK